MAMASWLRLGSESCATTWQDLQGVQVGEEVVVTDRGRAIARVLPMSGERTIDRLIREQQGHPGSEAAADAWNEASRIAGNRLLFARRVSSPTRMASGDTTPCISPPRVLDADLVLVAGDRALLAAAESLGLAVAAVD